MFTVLGSVNDNNGNQSLDIVIDSSGLIFLANGGDGIRVYSYHDSIFVNLAHADDAVYNITLDKNQNIFAAHWTKGMSAYTYQDSSLIKVASIDNGGTNQDIEVSPNNKILLANRSDGLRIYQYKDSILTNTRHINNGGAATDVALGPDGMVYVSNGGGGFLAYQFDGNILESKARINISNSLGESVTIAWGNTIFLADFYNGVFVYEYNDDAFIYKTHISGRGAGDIAVTPDSTVFVAFGDGLRAYTYEDSILTEIAAINNGGQAWGVEIGSDGTLFLANGGDGLRAYTFDGAAFTNTAHVDEGGFSAYDVALSSEGTAYVAYGSNGLCAYGYNGSSFTRSGKIDNGGSAHDVFIDKEGIIFCANKDDGLRAYVHNGSSFTNVGHIPDIFTYGVCTGEDNTVYLASTSGGLYVYQYSGVIESKNILLPREYQLYQNYPNPFNPVTTIGYDIKEDARVRLNIYNVSGRLIETLADEHHQAGHYKTKWDASKYSSGIYIYRLEYGDKHISRKMLLLK